MEKETFKKKLEVRGQITIPKYVRNKYALKPGMILTITIEDLKTPASRASSREKT